MEISKKTQSSLELLTKWGNENYTYTYTYSLYDFRDMELHGSFEECEIVEEWFEEDLRENGYDFLEFAYNKAGDPFALWIYPELEGEPPVVMLDSDGDVELLAPSLRDFVYLLTNEDALFGDNEDDKLAWYKIYSFESEEVKAKIKEEMKILNLELLKDDEASMEVVLKDFERHPNFKDWFEEYMINRLNN